MKIHLMHNSIAWIFIIDDYDYIPEQKESGPTYASGGEPGYPEGIEFNEYHLESNPTSCNKELIRSINAQMLESNRLCEHILAQQSADIYAEALELYHEELWP